MLDLSVIVATWRRPQLLAHCLNQYRQQSHGLRTECIVVSDGPDARAAATAVYYGCRYIELPTNANDWGATPNDAGIAAAKGDYVCFWNDDDLQYDRSLKCLHASAQGYDIGVCQCVHWHGATSTIIPPANFTGFRYAEIGTMCVCVRREAALATPWATPAAEYECDLRWCERLAAKGATIHFSPVVVGEHL